MGSKKKKRDIPHLGSPIIETHCHLDYLKDLSTEEILQKSQDVGVEKVITISVEPNNLDKVLSLTKSSSIIFGTQGIHPHQAKEWTDDVEAKIREQAKEDKILAIGEIGLDYHYSKSPHEVQREVFEKQLQIAIDLDLPVVIHSRDADEDTMSILKNFSNQMPKKGVIHSFTSGIDLAKFALGEQFYLGFNGIITFKNAENVREVLRITPMEQILLETDSPFLTPTPYRGVENAPYYLPFVAERMAEEKEVTVDELLPVVYQNSIQLFKF